MAESEPARVLTWEVVKARSVAMLGRFETWCYDCSKNWECVEMPCLKHCVSDDERNLRDERFHAQLTEMRLADNPFLKLLRRDPPREPHGGGL